MIYWLREAKKHQRELVKNSYRWAMQVRGLEQSRVDTRSWKAWALAFALKPRGPTTYMQCPMLSPVLLKNA